MTRGRMVRRVGLTSLLAVAVATIAGGCRAGDARSAAPALLGRAAPVPDTCAAADRAGALSFTTLEWMGEPVLACGPFAEDETYRFIFQSPERTSAPLSVRLSRSEAQAILIARRYAWATVAASPHPLSVTTSRVRPLTEPEWAGLVSVLRSAGFWDMPIEDGAAGNRAPAAAATAWNLEGRLGGGYHHVERPAAEGAFRDVARHMLQLAGYADLLDGPPRTQ